MDGIKTFFQSDKSAVVRLNVGGTIFLTSMDTLTADKNNNLLKILEKPVYVEGAIFIDRDPTNFRHILNFLRSGVLNIKPDLILSNELLVEADYYGIQGLKDLLQATLPGKSNDIRKYKEKTDQLENEIKDLKQEIKEIKEMISKQ
eukprot:TRINITY_DN1182_c0_g1_i1.p1 TRINITY_DN1182_c0_g1~~TRINITY_DN1182_c0_g1_i1.p1  ORF type:complete len:146 (-),score=29.53 TRINITY_DN1182_c0_g1_i1:64-501(-)